MTTQSSTYATAEGYASMLKHRTTEYLHERITDMVVIGHGDAPAVQQMRDEIESRVSA